ncbi:MAG: YHYH protein [Pyrinomonadaceae bacterium]|nr:YHYH protein [Pyrinomonadaceae bacterium]
MKNLIPFAILLIVSLNVFAHEGGHGTPTREWNLKSANEILIADFVRYEQNVVFLRDENQKIFGFDIADFSEPDKNFILAKQELLRSLNSNPKNKPIKKPEANSTNWLLGFGSILVFLSAFAVTTRKTKVHLTYGSLGVLTVLFVACSSFTTPNEPQTPMTDKTVPANDIAFMKSVFGSFSDVTNTSDDKYFYVSSNGIPDHNMMVGITNWQQQVPIPHDYSGKNSWAIPIQPVLSANPLSMKTNLLKGAIAIAANGIPIFNPLNNRGEDANAIGELDKWGGHCGRADDYHYHLPPTHLQTVVGEGKPIAYAVDGFPLYGETTDKLDEYLGKFNSDGSYQYHSVSKYPYLIAGMRGIVRLDPNTSAPENQVIPQAMTRGIRPDTRPLNGAEITGFESTGDNAYSLTYALDSEKYKINYSWDSKGLYTFEFVNPDGTTTKTYQR